MKEEDRFPDRMVDRTAGESLFHKAGTNGCKGSRLSHRGPDAGNKVIQSIRGSKRAAGSGREGRRMPSESYFGASPI